MNETETIRFILENSSEPVIKNPVLRAALQEPRTMAQEPRNMYSGGGLARALMLLKNFNKTGAVKGLEEKLIKQYKSQGMEFLDAIKKAQTEAGGVRYEGKIKIIDDAMKETNVMSDDYVDLLDMKIKLEDPDFAKQYVKFSENLKNKTRSRYDSDWAEANFGEEYGTKLDQARVREINESIDPNITERSLVDDIDDMNTANIDEFFGRKKNADGGVQQLVSNTVDGSRPGYSGKESTKKLRKYLSTLDPQTKVQPMTLSKKFDVSRHHVYTILEEYPKIKTLGKKEAFKLVQEKTKAKILETSVDVPTPVSKLRKLGGNTRDYTGVRWPNDEVKNNYIKDFTEKRSGTTTGHTGLSNEELAKKYFGKINTSTIAGVERTNRVLQQELDLQYQEGDPKEFQIKRKKRLKTTADFTASGTDKFPFHHVRQIGGEVPLTTDDIAVINKKMNSNMAPYNKILNNIADDISDNITLSFEAMQSKQEGKALDYLKKVDELNDKAEKIVKDTVKELPKEYKNLIGFNKFYARTDEYGFPLDDKVRVEKVGGAKITSGAIPLNDLTKDQASLLRKQIKKDARAGKNINQKQIQKILGNKEVQMSLNAGIPIDEILKSPAVKKALPWIKGDLYFAAVDVLNNWTKGQSFKKGAQKGIETGTFGLVDLAADEKALVDYAERQGLSKKEIDAMRNYLYYMKEKKNNDIFKHRLKFREANQGDSTQIADYGEQIFSDKDVARAKDKVTQSDKKLQEITDKYFETSFVGDEGAMVLQNMMEGLTAEEWNKPAGTIFDRGKRLDQGSGSFWDLFNIPFSKPKDTLDYLNPAVKKPQQELMIKHPVYGYKEQIREMQEKGIDPMEDINYSMDYALPKAEGGIMTLKKKR